MGNNLLDIENATIFHHYKTILNDVNLTLREGEFIYIIGKTGSGKSSLLRTIYSDIPLKMGTINFDNQNISQLSKAELPFLRRKIGIIFQDFQLFQDRNAYENIKFVMTSTGWDNQKKIDDKINSLLEIVGLENKGENYPYELSGGEQQRLVIARAIVNDPKLIIADEPTGNLDSKTSYGIMDLFTELHNRGNTIIMVTHEEDIAAYSKRIVRLKDGLISSDKKN